MVYFILTGISFHSGLSRFSSNDGRIVTNTISVYNLVWYTCIGLFDNLRGADAFTTTVVPFYQEEHMTLLAPKIYHFLQLFNKPIVNIGLRNL